MFLINVIMRFFGAFKREGTQSNNFIFFVLLFFFSIQLLNHSICYFNLLDFCYFTMQISVKF